MQSQRKKWAQCVAGLVVLLAWHAHAYQVLPKVSDVDREISRHGKNAVLDALGHWAVGTAIPYFKSPVHEAITLAALDCTNKSRNVMACVTPQRVEPYRTILYGVRWPDDPPFRLNSDDPPRIAGCNPSITLRSTAQPKCWLGLFQDAEKKAKRHPRANTPAFGPGDYLLYRSHFGDLQFMHAMGAYDGERAGDTFDRMKIWAEFLWGIATQATPNSVFLRDLGNAPLKALFPGDITATNLFATGIVEVRQHLDQVAIGVLLHMVQDSFSEAHAKRGMETGVHCPNTDVLQPGRIQRFHSYAQQSSSLHDASDRPDALHLHTLQASPSVVDISGAFLHFWRQKTPWESMAAFFDCVFAPLDRSVEATAGRYRPRPVPHDDFAWQ